MRALIGACAAGEWATAAVTVVAGLAAGAVVITQAIRRDPPWRGKDAE